MDDPAEVAKRIIQANVYMTLATADREGRPWVSPVWFAHEDFARFAWVSKPDARHSQNIAARPEVAVVIFDSTVGAGGAEAVYADARAERLDGADEERWIDVFNCRSEALGWPSWSVDDVRAPAGLRLYLATASALSVLGPDDDRLAVELG